MNLKKLLSGSTTGLAVLILRASLSFGQSDPLYIQFSPSAVKGALYHPDPPQPPPHVSNTSYPSHLKRNGKFDLHGTGEKRIHGSLHESAV